MKTIVIYKSGTVNANMQHKLCFSNYVWEGEKVAWAMLIIPPYSSNQSM